MKAKTKKQKGKRFEKFVASELKKIFKYVFSRADSGSGKEHKEDITLPDEVPLFIECKNHAKKDLKKWWRQTVEGCPLSKMPVLIYKLNYQKNPTVVMTAIDFLSLLQGMKNYKGFGYLWKEYPELIFLIEFSFNDFLNVLKFLYFEYEKA